MKLKEIIKYIPVYESISISERLAHILTIPAKNSMENRELLLWEHLNKTVGMIDTTRAKGDATININVYVRG